MEDKKKQKGKFKQKLTDKYRLVVLNEDTFEERFSLKLSRLNVFVLIGISWGSILSMPYAMLSSSIDPKKMGVFMGLCNMFIVLPQIIASLGGLTFLYKSIFGEEVINAMLLAGCSLILAGLSNFLITNKNAITYQENKP